jgi:hypothetical protein
MGLERGVDCNFEPITEREPVSRCHALSPEQEAKLIEACRSHQLLETVVALALHQFSSPAGLRRAWLPHSPCVRNRAIFTENSSPRKVFYPSVSGVTDWKVACSAYRSLQRLILEAKYSIAASTTSDLSPVHIDSDSKRPPTSVPNRFDPRA